MLLGKEVVFRSYLESDLYAASGNPVIRTPLCPLCRMLSPISSAVICSTMRTFSSLPPSIARMRGIFAARFAAVNRADARNLRCEVHGDLCCRSIVAAHDHVAIDILVSV